MFFLFMLQARVSSFVSLLVPSLIHLLFVRFLFIVLLYNNAYGIILFFSRDAGMRNFFFYHGFADLLRHILCPNLQFRTPLSILT